MAKNKAFKRIYTITFTGRTTNGLATELFENALKSVFNFFMFRFTSIKAEMKTEIIK